MRVAYVCADPGVPVFGHKGGSVHVQEVLRALRRRDADLDLVAMSVGGDPPKDLANVRVHRPPAPNRAAEVAARERRLLAANADIAAALASLGPFDFLYERYSLWSFAAMEYARAGGVPGLLEVNAPLVEEQARYRTVIDRAGAERAARRAFAAASALLAVSEEVSQWLLHEYPSVAGQVHVVPNGVNTDRFRPDVAPTRREPGAFTVGFVGTMRPWHGIDVLVDAFALLHRRVPHARLLAVGDGQARADAEASLAERELGHVAHFTGAVQPAEVPGLLASMDVGVAPYPQLADFYFSPLKLYEYMAMGLPVVASRIGSVARTIEDGVTGLLCRPGDAADLADELEQLASDEALRVRLGRAAREQAVRAHGWDAVAERILQFAGWGERARAPR